MEEREMNTAGGGGYSKDYPSSLFDDHSQQHKTKGNTRKSSYSSIHVQVMNESFKKKTDIIHIG